MTVMGMTTTNATMKIQPFYGEQVRQDPVVAEGKLGNQITYKLTKSGTLTISGSGSITGRQDEDSDEISDSLFLNSTVYRINVEKGITEIGAGAFKKVSGVTEVSLPDGLDTISSEAFDGCSMLKSVNIPDSVMTIGPAAFADCNSLTSVQLPSQLSDLSYSMFANDTSLTNVNLPDTINTIGDNAFYNCRSLKTLHIPTSLTTIGESAFEYCTSLNNVTLPESMQLIKSFAFHNCESLATINIPKNAIVIDRAFYGCLSLTSLTFDGDYNEYDQLLIQDLIDTLKSNKKKLTIYYPALAKEWDPYGQYVDFFNYG